MHKIMLDCDLIGYAYNTKHFQSDPDAPDKDTILISKRLKQYESNPIRIV